MALSLAFLAVAVLLAGRWSDRPQWSVGAYLAAWVMVPSAYVQSVGASIPVLGVHPAAWFIFAGLAAQAFSSSRRLSRTFFRNPSLILLAITVLAMCVVTVRVGRMPLLLDEIVIPVLALLLFLAAPDREVAIRQITCGILVLGLTQSLLGLGEFLSGRYLFYVEANSAAYSWYSASRFDRPMGTTGHALALGFLAAASVPLVVRLRHAIAQFFAAGLLFTGALVSQTRLSLIVAIAGVLYLIIRSHLGGLARAFLILGGLVGGVVVAAVANEFGTFARLGLDDGSADLRRVAYGWFIENWSSLPVVGDGMGSYGNVAHSVGLSTSLESSVLQLAVDFGIPLTLLLIASIFLLLMPARSRRRVRGTLPAAVAACTLTLTFSSIGNQTIVGPILFVLLAMAAPFDSATRPAGGGGHVFATSLNASRFAVAS